MGILDQLRDEVNLKQQNEFEESGTQQQLENTYKETILPIMQKTFTFLKEVVEHLGYLEKAIEITNYSQRFPKIGLLTQQNYQISTDGYGGFADFDKLTQINVTFICAGEGSFLYKLEGRHRIEREVAFLHSKKIPFEWNQFSNQNSTEATEFTIPRKIPVLFQFKVDIEHSKITLSINNHEDFNVYNKAFEPDEVNEALLDEVIRFMLRRDSDFIRLDINNQDKRRIQKKAEALQLQQAEWLSNIHVDDQQKDHKDKSNTLFDRINLFGKRKN